MKIYNYDKIENENVIFEAMNLICELNNIKIEVSLVITNKRLILFEDINKNSYIEVLNIKRKGFQLPSYYPVLEVKINDIERKVLFDDGTEINFNNNSLFIYKLDLINYL